MTIGLTHAEFIKKIDKNILKEIIFLEEYKNKRTKILATNSYGKIFINPEHLMRGSKPTILSAINKEEYFINQANEIYNNKYMYNNIKYASAKEKILITCKIHGDFLQSPHHHLEGSGCPKCFGPGLGEFARYKTYRHRLEDIGIVCKIDGDNDSLLVECFNCKKLYKPKVYSVTNKLYASDSNAVGDQNLYCSDKCKDLCPVFNFRLTSIDPRSKLYVNKTDREFARSCQTYVLKQLQCESHGYNYCEKCGDIIDVELHHTLEIGIHGKDAINHAGHILLCARCHIELHRSCS